MTWHTIDEEYPPRACRRCDVAYYAADGDEERTNVRAPSGVVHIERIEGPPDARMSAALSIILHGGRATYCGRWITDTE